MPGKGSKNCCCDGCHERPKIVGRSSGAIQEWENFCCACVPKQICVRMECEGSYDFELIRFERDCTEGLDYPILYSGEMPFEGYMIDLQFRFRIVNGQCYFCMTSAFLGIDESSTEYCHLIDAYARADRLFCSRLWLEGEPTQFTVEGEASSWTSWRSPTTSGTGIVGDIGWQNASNAYAADGSLAVVQDGGGFGLTSGQVSEYLQLQGFGFTASELPNGSTINAIQVRIKQGANSGTNCAIYDAQLMKGALGSPTSLKGDPDNISFYAGYFDDGPGDYETIDGGTWSGYLTGLAASTVRSSDFGFAIAAAHTSGGQAKPAIDHVQMRVNSTPSGASSGPAAQVCATANLTISVYAPASVAISGRSATCYDENGQEIEDTAFIRNLCGGCGCVPECACFTIRINDSVTQSIGCLADRGMTEVIWRTDPVPGQGWEVELVPNYVTNCCEVELIATGGHQSTEPLDNVRIGTSFNPCPNPSATWEFFDDDDNYYSITWEAAQCEGCERIIVECCNSQIAKVLSATVSISGGGCSCGSLVVPIAYDRTFGGWLGESDDGFCGHGISISLSCNDGVTWIMGIVANPCVVLPGESLNSYAAECDPLHLEFSFRVSGIGCCGPGLPTSPATITITITE